MYAGILIAKGGQYLGNDGLACGWRDAHIQVAGLSLAVLNSLPRIAVHSGCPAGVLDQDLTLGCQF